MPLKVYNPIAGRWFILHWWTDHDRGHLTFAKTVDELRTSARSVFTKEPYAECKGIYEIEMVGPSEKMHRLSDKHDRIQTVDTFYYEIANRVGEVIKSGKKPPPPFEVCKVFEPKDEEDQAKDEWAGERHYDCKNCDMKLKMGMTRDELYTKYAERWQKANPPYKHKPSPKVPQRSLSLAPPAADDEKLWFAYGNFGHHAGGV